MCKMNSRWNEKSEIFQRVKYTLYTSFFFTVGLFYFVIYVILFYITEYEVTNLFFFPQGLNYLRIFVLPHEWKYAECSTYVELHITRSNHSNNFFLESKMSNSDFPRNIVRHPWPVEDTVYLPIQSYIWM